MQRGFERRNIKHEYNSDETFLIRNAEKDYVRTFYDFASYDDYYHFSVAFVLCSRRLKKNSISHILDRCSRDKGLLFHTVSKCP